MTFTTSKRQWIFAAAFFLTAFPPVFLSAADLGQAEDPNIIWKAKVIEQPLQIKDSVSNRILVVTPEVGLEFNQVYQSPYMDVRDYRQISFFVRPVKSVNDDSKEPVVYQLDAFFSAENDMTAFKDFSREETRLLQPGLQEAGNTVAAKGQPETPSFLKSSTGETATRILFSPVYCPFVRIELRNKTRGDARKFRVTAYLMR